MPDIPNYNLQPTFPIASVIDAAQRNAQLQLQAQQAGQQSLVSGLQSIGQVGQSLYEQKLRMAQALAGAKMFAASPEGQQMMAPTVTPQPMTVMRNQTAAYDPSTGSVTPNTGTPGVGTVLPQTKTTITPPSIDLKTLQTGMLGESPSNMLTQLFERQKQRQQLGIEQQRADTEAARAKSEATIQALLAGLKGQETATGATHVKNEDVNALLARRAEITKDLPTGFLNSINNAKGAQAKKDIANIDAMLAAKGYSGASNSLPGIGETVVHPSGVKITRTK